MKILITAAALLPAAALAASPFDGTWRQNLDSIRVSGKPDVYLLADGEYSCSSCDPELKLKADGADHKVSGHAYYDTAMVKVTGPNSDELVLKHGGKVVVRDLETVSADGKTLTDKFTNYVGKQVVSGVTTETRIAPAPAGAHPVSGSWQPDKVKGNEVMRTVKYSMTPEHFTMEWNGQSYDAKFDGKEVPVLGDPGHTTVSVQRLDDNTVEETDHRQGKVVDKVQLAAAKDGKSIQVTDRDLAHGQTATFTLEKQ